MQKLSKSQANGLRVVGLLIASILGFSFIRSLGATTAPAPIVMQNGPTAPDPAPPPTDRTASLPPLSSPGDPKISQTAAPGQPAISTEIVVHVTGAVKKPGVYHLPLGSRGEAALEAAGGPLPDCDADAINLAARLEDETRLHFPTVREATEAKKDTAAPEKELVVVGTAKSVQAANPTNNEKASAAKPSAIARGGKSGGSKLTTPGQGSVNINTAGSEELQRLPGIGPAMAERVIAYRQENGGFKAPEDLLQVSGIGPKKFAKMQPFVRIR